MNRPRLTLLVASLFVVFTFVVAFASPAVAGSDSPTPYTVTAQGITFPAPLEAHGHVNVRLTNGSSRGLHLDPNNGHPGAAWIGATFLPWSALGITDGCVAWIQWSGANEHYGEGGQSPVCLTPTPAPTLDPTPTPEPSWTAEPEPSVEPTPEPTPTSPEPSSSPSPTQPVPSPEPSVTVEPTSEPEPQPSPSSTPPPSTPMPSSTPSTDLPPGPDVDHPEPEPDLPPTIGPPPVDPTVLAEPLPPMLPVTGAGTTLAWIAGGLLALGGVLVALARRRTPSPPGPADSPEAEVAAIRAARRGFTHPADTD